VDEGGESPKTILPDMGGGLDRQVLSLFLTLNFHFVRDGRGTRKAAPHTYCAWRKIKAKSASAARDIATWVRKKDRRKDTCTLVFYLLRKPIRIHKYRIPVVQNEKERGQCGKT
jgi:hypothetical protein